MHEIVVGNFKRRKYLLIFLKLFMNFFFLDKRGAVQNPVYMDTCIVLFLLFSWKTSETNNYKSAHYRIHSRKLFEWISRECKTHLKKKVTTTASNTTNKNAFYLYA